MAHSSELQLPAALAIPECQKGIGALIQSPQSADLIDGVKIQTVSLWPDDRGYFLEVARMGQGITSGAASGPVQVSAALSYPGTIKAFHYHQKQTDLWVAAAGMLQVALVDLRTGSSTYGRRNTLHIGILRPWQVLIPPGVAHGYKITGTDPAMLVYITDRFYDPADEGRIPYNHSSIQYDWETQHK